MNGTSRLERLIDHYPHYTRILRSIPYAAIRRITRRSCRGYGVMRPFFAAKHGLEIGGPSRVFRECGLIPVYSCCGRIDSCNFSSQTIWSELGENRAFGSSVGKQFVADATDLSVISDKTYDFVLACHVLEHIANPLRALQHWKRVLTPGGVLLAILPDKRGTFDHRRPFTSFEHIESDFRSDVSEDDLTHMNEVLELHDLGLDPGAGKYEDFRARCLRNPSVRAIHHHVFSPEVLVLMFTRMQMRLLNVAIERPEHIIVCAQRVVDENGDTFVQEHNRAFLSEDADWRLHDPLTRRSTSPQTDRNVNDGR